MSRCFVYTMAQCLVTTFNVVCLPDFLQKKVSQVWNDKIIKRDTSFFSLFFSAMLAEVNEPAKKKKQFPYHLFKAYYREHKLQKQVKLINYKVELIYLIFKCISISFPFKLSIIGSSSLEA